MQFDFSNAHHFENNILNNVYKAFTWSFLAYSSVNSPRYIELIYSLKHVQQRFTKNLRGLKI